MNWVKMPGDRWVCRVGPDARFTLEVFPKGDGRWSWQVFSGAAANPAATGVSGSLGGAKNVAEQLVKRLGAD